MIQLTESQEFINCAEEHVSLIKAIIIDLGDKELYQKCLILLVNMSSYAPLASIISNTNIIQILYEIIFAKMKTLTELHLSNK